MDHRPSTFNTYTFPICLDQMFMFMTENSVQVTTYNKLLQTALVIEKLFY